MPRTPRIPRYRHHKASGRGFVELGQRYIYCGKWGTPEAEQTYARVIAEWLANGRRPAVKPEDLTITELEAAYWSDAKLVYSDSPSQLDFIKYALRPLRAMYGDTAAAVFGPIALRTLQQHWASKGLSRKTVNDYISLIKRMFKWAVSRELVPSSVWHALTAVEGLRAGRSAARESRHVLPVSDSDIDAIREHVPPAIWALVQIQVLSGARSGELLNLRPCDIDRAGDVWTVSLQQHKGAWRGRGRKLHFGPQAQAVLRAFLLRPSQAYMFDPREAMAWYAAQRESHRRPGQEPTSRRTKRRIRDHYDAGSYRRAIQRACRKAGVTPWHPHALRHTSASRVRKEFGLEAAQVLLGHSRADVTQIYAERDETKAAEVARRMG